MKNETTNQPLYIGSPVGPIEIPTWEIKAYRAASVEAICEKTNANPANPFWFDLALRDSRIWFDATEQKFIPAPTHDHDVVCCQMGCADYDTHRTMNGGRSEF